MKFEEICAIVRDISAVSYTHLDVYKRQVKEFAAVDLSTRCFTVAFFAPPYEMSRLNDKTIRTNEWMERRYHRLRWDDGYIPYTDMSRTIAQISSNFTTMYTKGSEKAAFLHVYHRNVINLNEMNAPTANAVSYTHLDVYKRQDTDCRHQKKVWSTNTTAIFFHT